MVQVGHYVPHRGACFELFGLDAIIDERLRPWLLEVNTCPALGTRSAVDKHVKRPMLAELLHLVGPVPFDRRRLAVQTAAQDRVRLCSRRSLA